jgi:hypothetical protein
VRILSFEEKKAGKEKLSANLINLFNCFKQFPKIEGDAARA